MVCGVNKSDRTKPVEGVGLPAFAGWSDGGIVPCAASHSTVLSDGKHLAGAEVFLGGRVGPTVLGTGNGLLYTVAPTVTVSLTGTTTKVYDGTTTIAALSGTPAGVVTGDVVSISGAGSYADKNVGTNKNYTLTSGYATQGANIYIGLRYAPKY